MYTLESTLARLKIEDRIREANQQRLAHEFHRREQSSSTPTAVWEPGAHGPRDMAPDIRTLPQSGQLKGLVAYPGGGDLAEPGPTGTELGWSRPVLSGLPADRRLPNKGFPRVRYPEEDDPCMVGVPQRCSQRRL